MPYDRQCTVLGLEYLINAPHTHQTLRKKLLTVIYELDPSDVFGN